MAPPVQQVRHRLGRGLAKGTLAASVLTDGEQGGSALPGPPSSRQPRPLAGFQEPPLSEGGTLPEAHRVCGAHFEPGAYPEHVSAFPGGGQGCGDGLRGADSQDEVGVTSPLSSSLSPMSSTDAGAVGGETGSRARGAQEGAVPSPLLLLSPSRAATRTVFPCSPRAHAGREVTVTAQRRCRRRGWGETEPRVPKRPPLPVSEALTTAGSPRLPLAPGSLILLTRQQECPQ